MLIDKTHRFGGLK